MARKDSQELKAQAQVDNNPTKKGNYRNAGPGGQTAG